MVIMSEPNTFEPTEITIGETLTWTKSLSDYLPADGWTLTYYFRGAGKGFNAEATEETGAFLINVAATVTAEMSAGVYSWQAFVSKDDEKFLVDSGEVTAKAGFLVVDPTMTVDNRSEIKKTLDAIDAAIKGKATKDQMEYAIGNRQLKRYSISELIEARTLYAKLYSQERRTEKLKQGAPFAKTIRVRFKNPC